MYVCYKSEEYYDNAMTLLYSAGFSPISQEGKTAKCPLQ